jgi:hypothetical protein
VRTGDNGRTRPCQPCPPRGIVSLVSSRRRLVMSRRQFLSRRLRSLVFSPFPFLLFESIRHEFCSGERRVPTLTALSSSPSLVPPSGCSVAPFTCSPHGVSLRPAALVARSAYRLPRSSYRVALMPHSSFLAPMLARSSVPPRFCRHCLEYERQLPHQTLVVMCPP